MGSSTKRYGFLFLWLLTTCSGAIDDSAESLALEYASVASVDLGEDFEIEPSQFRRGVSAEFRGCDSETELPDWLQLSEDTCKLSGLPKDVGSFGPYRIRALSLQGQVTADLNIEVVAPVEGEFSEPTSPVTLDRYYMMTSLQADDRYLASFSSTKIYFWNAQNPFAPSLVSDFVATTVFGAGDAAQALCSTGQAVHVVSNQGRIASFDWSDRASPVLAASTMLLNGGQHFDVACDSSNTVFIANTTHTRFLVVNVSDLESPEILFQDDAVESYGAGVTYSDGYAYVTGYGGKLHTYTKDTNGDWAKVSDTVAISTASRPVASGGYLVALKYNSNIFELFSLADPAQPVSLSQTTLATTIGVYSRPVIRDSVLYLTQGSPGRVLRYSILEDGSLEAMDAYTPQNDSDQDYTNVRSLLPFWRGSFLGFLVDTDNGTNLTFQSRYFPLTD